MAAQATQRFLHNIDKRFLSKNKSVKIYKEKKKKIEIFKNEVDELTKRYDQVDPSSIQKFDDFPLSERTQKGLKKCNYETPTDIQKESIGLALQGRDILGAAKTGSGKTLAFVIPILEHLYVLGWSILDGLGALIITPTRELAYQIYEVFNKVGANHQFSVALVIGGKDLAKEKKLLNKCNIIISTPGRLLQHMDENPLFDTITLKILVLDEADRILDMGFEKTMNAILENLPKERQTLLFSATQTKSVRDLARLSLKNPMYVSVHEHAKHSTPAALQQSYMVCDAEMKMNLLWSFLKNHKKQKILVFMASCKQVKYTFESFCRLRPGISVMSLYGSLHQLRRMQIYDEFCRKNHVVMIATDIASRGLDFPNVNWVVQLDCPEDVNTYIHRAGRTARYQKGGESLLVLLPSEKESMLKQLEARKIPIEEIKANPKKLVSIQKKLEVFCARDVNLKESAQRAFKAYLKNIFLMKDKSVFDVTKINREEYSKSLGLAFPPRIRFLEKKLKNASAKSIDENMNLLTSEEKDNQKTKDRSCSLFDSFSESESDDELLKPKKTSVNQEFTDSLPLIKESSEPIIQENESRRSKKPLTKAAIAKKILKKKIKPNTIIKFDENGEPIKEICGQQIPAFANEIENEILKEGYSIEKAKQFLDKEDTIDKMLYKEKIKQKHREKRLKMKELKRQKNPESTAQLGSAEGESEASGDDMVQSNDMPEFRNESERESSHDSDPDEHPVHVDHLYARKRKISSPSSSGYKKLKMGEPDDDSGFLGHFDEEEALALQFLQNA